MAALPAGALLGTGQKPTGTDPQGGGLQSQTAGGNTGKAKSLESLQMERAIEPMKNKNQNELDGELDGDKSIFDATHCRRDRSLSKTTPFADISVGVVILFGR